MDIEDDKDVSFLPKAAVCIDKSKDSEAKEMVHSGAFPKPDGPPVMGAEGGSGEGKPLEPQDHIEDAVEDLQIKQEPVAAIIKGGGDSKVVRPGGKMDGTVFREETACDEATISGRQVRKHFLLRGVPDDKTIWRPPSSYLTHFQLSAQLVRYEQGKQKIQPTHPSSFCLAHLSRFSTHPVLTS